MDNTNKIWKYFLYGLLGFHALYQLGFGLMTWINPQSLEAPYGFDAKAAPQIYLIVLMLSFGQLFLTAMAILGIYWVSQNRQSGALLGMLLGCYFLCLGIAGIIAVDQRVTLFIDVARGILTIVSAFMVFKNTKN